MTSSDFYDLRSNLYLVAVNVVMALVASVIIARTYALYHNSLVKHPEWISTKPTLERGVMGAVAFENLQQSLAGNRLNLGAYFGFQEVLYREPLDLSEAELFFRLEAKSYVHVLYDVERVGFSGIRVSNHPDFPSIRYRATSIGEFVHVDTLVFPTDIRSGAWYRVRLAFGPERVDVMLDDRKIGGFRRSSGERQFGFRGGHRNAWVDDVVLRTTDGLAIRESFANTRRAIPTILGVLGVLVVSFAAVGLIRHVVSATSFRMIGFGSIMMNSVLIVAASGAYFYQFANARAYPRLTQEAKQREAYWAGSARRVVMKDLRARFGQDAPGNTYRILFLGASQTWGAGARVESEVWVRELERRLNAQNGETKFECINAGISSLTSGDVLTVLREDLLDFKPRAAVVNLSNNDVDTAAFRTNLEQIVTTLLEHNIRPILIPEPNATERGVADRGLGDIDQKHGVVQVVARHYGVPVVDLHEYLAARADAGFIWWDFVHLTSFGQRLVAERLSVELPSLLMQR